jgi:hypothetical protein
MSLALKTSILVLLISPYCFSQDPMPVLNSSWQRTIQKAQKPTTDGSGPMRGMTAADKYFPRKAREGRVDPPNDPSLMTEDDRRAAIEKAEQESRMPKSEDVHGFSYLANVRNDSGKTVKVIFWEYRFTEIARPTNVVRRQFLCSVNLKNGDSKDLSVFSLLAPSDVIDAESLAKSTDKLFDEKVFVNRIEFSDGTLRQRGNWKYEDVQKSVERATSVGWGNETCRGL